MKTNEITKRLQAMEKRELTHEFQYKGLTSTIKPHFGGLCWRYENKEGDFLSVIIHSGSYGREAGLFETMCSWKKDVQGYLNFGQVQRKLNTLIKRTNAKK